MKSVAGTLKLSLAQYREMEAFAQFGSDLDQATQDQIANGQRQVEMLKQGQYSPMSMEEQVISLYAATPQKDRVSWIRNLELEDIGRFESEMQEYFHSSHQDVLDEIRTSGKLSDETEAKLIAALDNFAEIFQPSGTGSASDEAA